MTPSDLRLLGFDVRLSSEDYVDREWNDDRRRVYLLKPGTSWPLSVDTSVWPSVFFSKAGMEPIIAINDKTKANMCWLDFRAMVTAFTNGWKRPTPGIAIGISLLAGIDATSDQFGFLALNELPTPPEWPGESDFLGYDVADSGWISGLADCGYWPEEKGPWAQRWEQHLNEYGLLKTLDAAQRFKSASDARVPEHAPFFVFGLSRLTDLSQVP